MLLCIDVLVYWGGKSWHCVFPKGKKKQNKSNGITEQRKRPRNWTNLLLLYRLIKDAVVPSNHYYSSCPLPSWIFALLLWEYVQSCSSCQRMMLLFCFSFLCLDFLQRVDPKKVTAKMFIILRWVIYHLVIHNTLILLFSGLHWKYCWSRLRCVVELRLFSFSGFKHSTSSGPVSSE